MLRDLSEASSRHSAKWSSYFSVYERVFARFVGKGITLVEVGVADGASLQLWKAYFQNARVIGVDIDPRLRELSTLGVEIMIGDQASPEFWDQFYKTVGPIDVLIDDGGHTNEQQIVTVTHALANVRDEGVILVEDVHTSYQSEYLNPSRSSFVNFAKHLVDCVNSRSPVVNRKAPYRHVISSLEFHESIVVIHVDRARASMAVVGEEGGVEPETATVPRPAGLRSRLQFVRHIPLAGPLMVKCFRLWNTAVMDRRLSRYFR